MVVVLPCGDRQGADGDPTTASSVRSVNEQPENAPFGQFVAKSGVWLPWMVNRTKFTPVAGTVVGGVLAETLGARTTMFIGAVGALPAALWLFWSPVRRLRQI